MKRMITYVICISMFLTQVFAFNMVYVAAQTEPVQETLMSVAPSNSYKTIWYDDFEDGTVGEILDNDDYNLSMHDDCLITISDEQCASGSKSIKFTKNKGVGISMKKTFAPVEDILLEAKVWTQNWVRIDLMSDSVTASRLYIRNGNLYYYNGQYQLISPISYSQWNTLRIESNIDSGTYRVYKNGEPLKADVPMENRINSVDSIVIQSGSAEGYVFYIDDLHIAKKVGIPGDFSLKLPENNQERIPLPALLIWEASEDAEIYQVMVDTSSDFSNPVVNKSVQEETYAEIAGLEYNKKYFWKVSAINSAGEKSSNEVFSFSTVNPVAPGKFSLVSPLNNSNNVILKPTLSWNPASNATKYSLMVDDNSDFSSPLIYEEVLTETYNIQEGLEHDKQYFWKVTATNSGFGESGCDEVYSFRTQPRYYIEQVHMTDFFGNPVDEQSYPEYIRMEVLVACNIEELTPIVIVFEKVGPDGTKESVYVRKQMKLGEKEAIKADVSLPENAKGYSIRAFVIH